MSKIAIVGTSCLFPGAHDPDQYWDNLLAGRDLRSEASAADFGMPLDACVSDAPQPNRIYSRRGGFIRDFRFNPEGYLLPAAELERLDAVFQWSLHTAREALRSAGYRDGIAPASCGVVMGNYAFPTPSSNRLVLPVWHRVVARTLEQRLDLEAGALVRHVADTSAGIAAENRYVCGMPAAMVASALGAQGPQYAIDAACASALYAIDLACRYLRSGRADVMLAGGVCAPDPWLIHLSFSDLHAYPDNGCSQPFSQSSRGIHTGQGAGIVVLKRIEDALAAGDRILAVIEAIGLSNDGSGKHLLSPNPNGQQLAYERAYASAGIAPDRIDYVECHATGTPLGDATELGSLEAFFHPCGRLPRLGSVKGNVGHLLTVAGMSSLLKVILAMNHGVIPATINVDQPRRSPKGLIDGAQLVRENEAWPLRDGKRYAAVSSFGFGGTNAHLILSQWDGADAGAAGGVSLPGATTSVRASATRTETAPATPRAEPEPIAIIGIGAHFGGADTLDAFEAALYRGEAVRAQVAPSRWRGVLPPGEPNDGANIGADIGADIGAFVETVAVDPLEFRIPPAELTHFNPQQLLMLKVADEALRDAGFTRGKRAPAGRRVGVVLVMELDLVTHLRRARGELAQALPAWFAGAGLTLDDDEQARLTELCGRALHHDIQANEVLSYIGNIMASRIASLWNFTGPVLTLSADGNGVAEALEAAQLMLAEGEAEAMLVGAVDLAAGAEELSLRPLRALAPQLPIAPGEGAGALVLTPVSRLQGRRSYATLAGIAIGRARIDGEISADAIAGIAQRALARAQLAPEAVGLIECDGADAACFASEHRAMAATYASADAVLGCARSQFGHCGLAAPMAALIRAALALHHRYLPALPNWPEGAQGAAPFNVLGQTLPWLGHEADTPKAAALGSLGPAGSYAHVLLRGADRAGAAASDLHRYPLPLLVVADDQAGLSAALARVGERLKAGEDLRALRESLLDAYREDAALAFAIGGADRERLISECEQAIARLPGIFAGARAYQTPAGSYFTPAPQGRDGKIAFVYPGGFTAYPMIGRDLFRAFPDQLAAFETRVHTPRTALAAEAIYPMAAAPLGTADLMRREQTMLDDIPTMLTIGTSLALLYTQLLREAFGVREHGAFGYSLGESSMLFGSGVWPATGRSIDALRATPLFRDRLTGARRTVREAWSLGADVPDAKVWAGMVLLTEVEAVEAALRDFDRLYITHVNSPREVVVAGDPAQLQRLAKALGCQSFRTPTAHVLHAPVMAGEKSALADLNRYETRARDGLQLISAARYAPIARLEREQLADDIADTLCRTVDFRRLTETAYAEGYRVFIEVGPGGACARWVQDTLGQRPHFATCVARRGLSDTAALANVVAQLVSHRVPVDLRRFRAPGAAAVRRSAVVVGGQSISEAITTDGITPRPAPVVPVEVAPAVAAIDGMKAGVIKAGAIEAVAVEAVAADTQPTAAPLPEAMPAPLPIAASMAAASASTPATARTTATTLTTAMATSLPAPAIQRIALPMRDAPAATASPLSRPLPERIALPTAIGQDFSAEPPYPSFEAFPMTLGSNPPGSILIDAIEHGRNSHLTFLKTQAALDLLVLRRLTRNGGAAAADAEQAPAATPLPPAANERAPATVAAFKPAAPAAIAAPATVPAPAAAATVSSGPVPLREGLIWDERQLLEFASGSVANIFGPEYAAIDGYSTRVRLPAPPYFFVSRVTRLQAERGRYEPCQLTTEYDIPHDAWYLVDGQMPPGVAVEAGQSDLLLIAYLGIDFQNQGHRRYRLLDGKLKFLGPLPRAGQTLRFDIRIDRFVRQGPTLLFFFAYEGYVDGTLALRLEEGCAGFFSEQELTSSMGVVLRDQLKVKAELCKPMLRHTLRSLDRPALEALSDGRIADVFGPRYQHPESGRSVRLPPRQLLMLDRVLDIGSLDADGVYRIVAEKDLQPDAWYFTAHFVDDPVMPGSLVAEGATQLLKLDLIASGMHHCFADAEFETIPELMMQIRVRGQITPDIKTLRYEMRVIERGFLPRPFVRANVVVFHGDKPLVSVENLGLCVREKAGVVAWPRHGEADYFSGRKHTDGTPVVLNEFHLAHAAKGDLKTAMGERFAIYDNVRGPHIPNGDFQFVDRALSVTGVQPKAKIGDVMVTEYDSPADAWYYRQNNAPTMPNCVYLETALQASILLGYYLGATLPFPGQEFCIRNLEGHARYVKRKDLRGKTIQHRERLLSQTALQGAVLENYAFELFCEGELIYAGESLFGYFSPSALVNQVGLDSGKSRPYWHEQAARPLTAMQAHALENEASSWFRTDPARPHYRLAGQQLNLLHRAHIDATGGRHGKGYVFGYREIRENDWYFKCHFHRDPVMPGSLGLEALHQALQLFALERGLGRHLRNPCFALATDTETEWKYRGQILRSDRDMAIEVHVREIVETADSVRLIADCELYKDHLRIYEVKALAIDIVEAEKEFSHV